MILIFGGAYQGKLAYAKENFQIDEKDVFFCKDDLAELDTSKKVIADLEKFTYACVAAEENPVERLDGIWHLLEDKILIADDVSQGVVPMDKTARAWREANGRVLIMLGKRADQVIRVFCGLGQRVK